MTKNCILTKKRTREQLKKLYSIKRYTNSRFRLKVFYLLHWRKSLISWGIIWKCRSSQPEVFLGKDVLKICSNFTGEHILNLLDISRTPFLKNTSWWLLLKMQNCCVNATLFYHGVTLYSNLHIRNTCNMILKRNCVRLLVPSLWNTRGYFWLQEYALKTWKLCPKLNQWKWKEVLATF